MSEDVFFSSIACLYLPRDVQFWWSRSYLFGCVEILSFIIHSTTFFLSVALLLFGGGALAGWWGSTVYYVSGWIAVAAGLAVIVIWLACCALLPARYVIELDEDEQRRRLLIDKQYKKSATAGESAIVYDEATIAEEGISSYQGAGADPSFSSSPTNQSAGPKHVHSGEGKPKDGFLPSRSSSLEGEYASVGYDDADCAEVDSDVVRVDRSDVIDDGDGGHDASP